MMRYSRYRVNYILWAVYGLVICIYFTVQTSLVCSMLGLGWMFYFLGTAGCAFLLILMVYLPIRTLAGMKNREKQCMPRSPRRSYVQEGARHAQLWECLFLIFAIAAALALRLWMASAGGAELFGDKSLYEIAAAAAGGHNGLEGINFRAVFLYLLTGLFSRLGVWENTCILLQIGLQIAAIAVLYPAIRMIAGRIVAVAAVTAAALLPVYVEYCLAATPESLRMLFFALALLLIGLLLRKLRKSGKKSASSGLFVFLTGIAAGFLSFMDYFFLSLFFLGFLGILYLERRSSRRGTAVREAAVFLAAGACGFGAAMGLQLFLFGGEAGTLLQDWFSRNMVSQYIGWGSFANQEELFYFLPLLFFAYLYVFGFFEQKGNLGIIWIIPFVFLLVSDLLFGTSMEKQTITLLFWGVFAGMGVHSMCCFNEEKKKKQKVNAADMIPQEQVRQEEAAETAPLPVPQPGEPIPNPLPGPKKHVPREMDYAFEPDEQEMCFDIENLDEKDDFDLL